MFILIIMCTDGMPLRVQNVVMEDDLELSFTSMQLALRYVTFVLFFFIFCAYQIIYWKS